MEIDEYDEEKSRIEELTESADYGEAGAQRNVESQIDVRENQNDDSKSSHLRRRSVISSKP